MCVNQSQAMKGQLATALQRAQNLEAQLQVITAMFVCCFQLAVHSVQCIVDLHLFTTDETSSSEVSVSKSVLGNSMGVEQEKQSHSSISASQSDALLVAVRRTNHFSVLWSRRCRAAAAMRRQRRTRFGHSWPTPPRRVMAQHRSWRRHSSRSGRFHDNSHRF